MTLEPVEPIWEKELERFTLQEYERKPHSLSCTILYHGTVYAEDPEDSDEDEIQFSFMSWGMEREEITAEQCFMTCQSLLWSNANVSISSFAACLAYALPDFEEEEYDE
ncbi:hypothetical protein A6769_22090 [Nostoc punctiforme NIES-2108]|uniref:Uncharacterized protein n=1 Tax=Nostoc punctiforme NIES-2108 TaxID=1356359 RepID=A0A367RH46_NOSPU|nr:hypothetical protein A6769_22090 [Nostoc punctiforme NIES-2108]